MLQVTDSGEQIVGQEVLMGAVDKDLVRRWFVVGVDSGNRGQQGRHRVTHKTATFGDLCGHQHVLFDVLESLPQLTHGIDSPVIQHLAYGFEYEEILCRRTEGLPGRVSFDMLGDGLKHGSRRHQRMNTPELGPERMHVAFGAQSSTFELFQCRDQFFAPLPPLSLCRQIAESVFDLFDQGLLRTMSTHNMRGKIM